MYLKESLNAVDEDLSWVGGDSKRGGKRNPKIFLKERLNAIDSH